MLSDQLKIGFIVNPFAGAGGPAGLKGSDDINTRDAVAEGRLAARAPQRAQQFVDAFNLWHCCQVFTCPQAMGENYFTAQADTVEVIEGPALPLLTNAEHTKLWLRLLQKFKLDLLIFVGGDGTARDICQVVGQALPVLGVPSGVKMHSSVFAITPILAAQVLTEIIEGKIVSLVESEVRDIDEAAFQQGVVRSRHFGSMMVPEEVRYIQGVKQGGVELDELVLLDIAEEIRQRLQDEENAHALIIFSSGSTTHFIQQELGVEGTLLGVDLVKDGKLLATDVSAQNIEKFLESEGDGKAKAIIVLTAIGGQGYIVGRGNQQLSPKVLRHVGRDNLWIVTTKTKLKHLNSRPLLMDSNDVELDRDWQGLIPVITGYCDQTLYRLGMLEGEIP